MLDAAAGRTSTLRTHRMPIVALRIAPCRSST